jgi:hypothetical protein
VKSLGWSSRPSSSFFVTRSFSDCERSLTRTRFLAYSGRGASARIGGVGSACVRGGGGEGATVAGRFLGVNGESQPSGRATETRRVRSEEEKGREGVRRRDLSSC